MFLRFCVEKRAGLICRAAILTVTVTTGGIGCNYVLGIDEPFAGLDAAARGTSSDGDNSSVGRSSMVAVDPNHLYCRAVTEAPRLGWDERRDGCFAGSSGNAKELYWRSGCVGYGLKPPGTRQLAAADVTAVIDTAFATWVGAVCEGGAHPSIQAFDRSSAACGGPDDAAAIKQNAIAFYDDDWPYGSQATRLGFTSITHNPETGEILEADVQLNSASHTYAIGPGVPEGSVDLRSVVLHELGHFFGLGHSRDPNAIMASDYAPTRVSLTRDDVEGICSIYPPNGTRVVNGAIVASTPCDDVLREGMASGCSVLSR